MTSARLQVVRRFPWKFFLTLVLVAICASAGAVFGLVRWLRSDLPAPEHVAQIHTPVKTVVYDVHGRVLHEFYRENRSTVPIQKIPSVLIRATLSTEDRNFYQHWGIDLWGVSRALVTDVMHMRRTQGGSTITQQLARNLFLTHERSFSRKLKEAALAIELERNYSKDQILEMYFNQIYFGEGAYGVEAAAKTYFAKPLRELTLPEAALLAGIPANPSLYAPRRRPAAALARRDKVLRNMLATEAITQADYEKATHAPLGITSERYANDRAPYFVEMVRLHLDDKYGTNAVYEGGLKVWTTLDPELQTVAEQALEKQLTQLEAALRLKVRHTASSPAPSADSQAAGAAAAARSAYLQGAVVVIDPRTGQIRAMVGGRDWNDSNFNRATQAMRQPGSAFKPFVYVAAIDNGFRPTDVVTDEPVSYPAGDGQLYEPQNYDRKFRGPVTLRYALQHSINVPAIKLLRKVGTSVVVSYARRMGIHTPLGQNLSLALGSSEVTLLDITSAYGVFANRGIRNDPVAILRVEDRSGQVLERSQPRPTEVLSEQTAATMTSLLESVMDHGTGYPARARGFLAPAAGKTGTMDEYKDAWFVGFIPSLVCGVWVGFDQKRVIGPGMTGARAALPVWSDVMMAATRGRPAESFPSPVGEVTRVVCTETGMLATDLCPSTVTESFPEGAEPTEPCSLHPGRPLAPGQSGPPAPPPGDELPPPGSPTGAEIREAPRD